MRTPLTLATPPPFSKHALKVALPDWQGVRQAMPERNTKHMCSGIKAVKKQLSQRWQSSQNTYVCRL